MAALLSANTWLTVASLTLYVIAGCQLVSFANRSTLPSVVSGVTVNTKQLIQAVAANLEAGATLDDAMEAAMGCDQYDKLIAVLLGAIQAGRDKVMLNEIMEDVCE